MLQSVDRHVATFIAELKRLNQLDNTIIIFTSDNGYQLGQHRLTNDKRHLYEHDIRVPMIVRGPGVPKNAINGNIVLNIDLAPTIAELATGSEAAAVMMDGRSFLPLLPAQRNELAAKPWRSDFLVSYFGEGNAITGLYGNGNVDALNNTYHCVRTIRNDATNSMYCEFDDDENFVEYYDLATDPWQLDNRANELRGAPKRILRQRLTRLKNCQGGRCRLN
ncbi:hypothetical protein MPSEU_000048500 [Mayamaea pseudoterrestris]|nr:hypothetical protein MPSEU_000048500 [Mayamaea pseudoterrestris]